MKTQLEELTQKRTTNSIPYMRYGFIEFRVIAITPEQAKKMLEKNKINRKLSRKKVLQYIAEMLKNNWLFTGDPISFDSNGNLINGQHRLQAIVESGKPQLLLVIVNLDTECFKVLDTGKARNGGDVLHIAGYKYDHILSSVIKKIIMWNRGFTHVISSGTISNVVAAGAGSNTVTNTDIIEFARQNKDRLYKIINTITSTYKSRLIGNSDLCFAYWLFSKINDHDADVFIKQIVIGTDLNQYSPSYLFRERMIRNQASKEKLSSKMILALLIKAWNKYRLKEVVKILRWGSKNEPFPEPI